MLVNVLLYKIGNQEEGIHSIDIKGKTIVLMFEDPDDAERYCGLLEAQDFPTPSVEKIDQDEINLFCIQAGYEARLVVKGFVPKTEEDRLLISPPQRNLDVNLSSENTSNDQKVDNSSTAEDFDNIRKNLENLL